MRKSTLVGLASLLAMSSVVMGCGSDAGELVVILQTDLDLPKDINTIRLEVFNNGVPKFKNDYEKLGEAENQPFLLPGTLTLLGSENPGDTIRIMASARRGGQGGKLRMVREVYTTVPQQRTAALQLPIQFLCDGQGSDDGDGEVSSGCPGEKETCISGKCVDAVVDSSILPDYSAGDVYVPGVCLDVKTCFDAGAPVVPDADCSIPATAGVNLALATEGDGICGAVGCFVALDAESSIGWQTRDDGRIQITPEVCAQITDGEIVGIVSAATSAVCPSKTFNVPTCGPWSAAGSGDTTITTQVIAGGQGFPISLAVFPDATSSGEPKPELFWAAAGTFNADGAIKRVPLNGGEVTVVAAGTEPPRNILALPDGRVLWTIADSSTDPMSTLGEIQLFEPGSGDEPAALVSGLKSAEGIAVAGNSVFWTEFGEQGSIMRADITGAAAGNPVSVATGQAYPFRIQADSSHVYWTNEGESGMGNGQLMRQPLPSGASVPLATALATPRGMVLDLDDTGVAVAVYWVNFDAATGAVMRIDLSGGMVASPEQVGPNQNRPTAITLDDTHVYWSNRGDGTIWRAPKGGAAVTPELLAEGQTNPGEIQVFNNNIYWINQSTNGETNGALVRLAKPAAPTN